VITEYLSLLSHYFPYYPKNNITLYPCESWSSGQTQILSSRHILRTLPESSNFYMWLRTTFLSYPPTFLTWTISSCLVSKVEVVDGPKSYKLDVLCVHYPSHQTITRGYEVLFYLILPTFLTCKRIVSSCLVAKVEVVDGPKSYQVDTLCVHYPSHQTVTCGYKVLFSLSPILSLLFRDLYHLGSLTP
jgi:hypothetical protein